LTGPPLRSSMTLRTESDPKKDPGSWKGSESTVSRSSWRSRRAETESATRVEEMRDLHASDNLESSRPFIFIPGITGKALCLVSTKTSQKSTSSKSSKSTWPSKPPMIPSSRMPPKQTEETERGDRSNATIVSARGGQDAMSVSSHHSVISDITMLSLTSRGTRRSSSSKRRSKSTPRSVARPESLKCLTSLIGAGDRYNALSPLATPSGRQREKVKKAKSSMETEPSKSSNRDKQYRMATDAPSRRAVPREFGFDDADFGLHSRAGHSREQRRPARSYSVEPTSTSRYLRKIDPIPSSSAQSLSSFQDHTGRAQRVGASSVSDTHQDVIGSSKRSGRSKVAGRSRGVEKEDYVSTSSSAMTTNKKKKKSKSSKITESSKPLTETNESLQKKTTIQPAEYREKKIKCLQSHSATLDALNTAFPVQVRRQHSVNKSEFGLYTTHQTRHRSLSRGKSTHSGVSTNYLQDQDAIHPISPSIESLSGSRETSIRSERTYASTSNLREQSLLNSRNVQEYMKKYAGDSSSSDIVALEPKTASLSWSPNGVVPDEDYPCLPW
jgi:hypothetical protein